MNLDNQLRASIAAEMLMPREDRVDSASFKRLQEHLLQLRKRVAEEAEEMHEAQREMDAWRHQLDQEDQQ